MAAWEIQRKLTAILCAEAAGKFRRLKGLGFCLLLPFILALWGCGDGLSGPASGIASNSKSVSTEYVTAPGAGVSGGGRDPVAGIFARADSAAQASGTIEPEGAGPAPDDKESAGPSTSGQAVAGQPQGLEACIAAAIGGGWLVSQLSCNGQGIVNLQGIEELQALTTLELNDNQISDLAPLARLTKLQSLKLAANQVEDIRPLAALTELTDLILDGNRIDDVAPLADLNKLMVLHLGSNRISDVDDLGVMEELRYLKLNGNEISDVSSLGQLTRLEYLHLSANSVTLGVRNLETLKAASSIVMVGNDYIACSDLNALEDALAGDVLIRPSACAPY